MWPLAEVIIGCNSVVGIATSPCAILYIIIALFLARRSSKDVHWRISSIDVTLLVGE